MSPPMCFQVAAVIAASLVTSIGAGHQAMEGAGTAASAVGTSSPAAKSDLPVVGMQGMPMPVAKPATQPVSVAGASNGHVSPPPPAHSMAPMVPARMIAVMQMDDQATRGMLLVDRLERTGADGAMATVWETDAWWGGDIDKLWLRSEGEKRDAGPGDVRAELLWNHAFATVWDWRLGLRDDSDGGPTRQWAALGVQGLAPYWFDLDATFYAGTQGRAAARLEASYDLRLSQRLILTPDLELNFYARNDPRRDVRAGLSDGELGLRLRYEFNRRFAPYLGANWSYSHDHQPLGPTPDRDGHAHDLSWLLGVRFWF